MAKRKTEINDKTKEVLKQYLEGDLSTRAAARELGISHQAVINLIASILKQWYGEGSLIVKPFLSNGVQQTDSKPN
jgi:DNA-directed RNA polymerase specialized sigma subunit